MQPLRATLTDDSGQLITDIEGSIQSPEEANGPRQGQFELEDNGAFMQGVLDKKTFRLEVHDGSQLTIHVNSGSTISRPGYSRVEFSCL
jgi:hypothetical protein